MELLKDGRAEVDFELDRWGKDPATGRDIGLIVVGMSFGHPATTIIGRETATALARQGYEELLGRRRLQMSTSQQTT